MRAEARSLEGLLGVLSTRIGDSRGELAAMVLIDAAVRLLPGVLGAPGSPSDHLGLEVVVGDAVVIAEA